MLRLVTLALVGMVVAATAVAAPAQEAAATPAPTLSARSTLVLAPALVRDKAGKLVYTLSADDFVLTDDGVPQTVRLEQHTAAQPLAMVVVVEVGGSATRQFERYGALAPALGPMLEAIVGAVPHRVAVVVFDSEPNLYQPFTPEIGTAQDALAELTPGCTRQHHMDHCGSAEAVHDVALGDDGVAILDTLRFSVDLLRKEPAEYRRAILLVSETNDRGSKATLEQALRAVSDSNTEIYALGFSSAKNEAGRYATKELPTGAGDGPTRVSGRVPVGENHHPNPPHGCMGKDPDPAATKNKAVQAFDCAGQLLPPLALAKLAAIAAVDGLQRNVPETVARLTGGEYFKLGDEKSLERSLETISNHLANRYVLSFQPQSPHPGLHALSLRVPQYANLSVTARSSYWAEGEAGAP